MCLLSILVLATALRLWGIADRLPDSSLGISVLDDSAIDETDRTTMFRAWGMWGGDAGRLSLDPQTAGWPGLSFYCTLATQVLYKLSWQTRASGKDTQDFIRHVQTKPDAIFLFARCFGVALGVLTVWLTYLVGAASLGPATGLLAAGFLAVNPLHVLSSQHISDPNLLALLFVLLAAIAMLRIGRSKALGPSILAGLAIGLATACKYVPAVLLAVLVQRHWVWARSGRGSSRTVLLAALAGLVAALVGFALGSPYALLNGSVFSRDVGSQVGNLFSDWTGQSEFPIALPTYLVSTLPAALGLALYALAIAGSLLIWRKGPDVRQLVLTPLLLILANGALSISKPRYVLPAVPFLLLASSEVVRMIVDAVAKRTGKGWAAPAALLIAAVALPSAVEVAKTRAALAAPDSRHVSRRWLSAHIPPSAPMVVELYGPVVNSLGTERLAVTWPFYAAQPEAVSPAYQPEFLDGFIYYVASSEVGDRFTTHPRKYPQEAGYYRWLATHSQVVWRSDSTHASGPTITIRALPSGISSQAARDSAWVGDRNVKVDSTRVASWCRDMAVLFSLGQDYSRASEWAIRGLTISPVHVRIQLLAQLANSRLQLGDADGAVDAAELGIAEAPGSANLHLQLGMALQGKGDRARAAAEYEESLRLDPQQQGAELIRQEIARLQAPTRP